MSMRTLVLVFLGMAALSVLVNSVNAGGEAAHLGGAAVGFLLIRRPRLLNWAEFGGRGYISRTRANWQSNYLRQQQRRIADEDAQVDRILGKVRDQGLHSLTGKEKKILNRATQRRRGQ